ncbi:MAG: DUF58 domain-containing protein [Bradymonadaceae bacterium]
MTELRDEYLDPGVVEELEDMEVRARVLVDGILSGLHASPHRGGSVEFAEYTEYTPGDELRHVDWKVYAKTDEFYIKEYEDETNLRAYFVIDSSGSMNFASERAEVTKLRYVSFLAATFAYLLVRQGDAVGALNFADESDQFLPASSSRSHLEDFFWFLEEMEGEGETSYHSALQTLGERAPQRSMIFVFSDFLEADEETLKLLRVLKAQRRDVAAFHVVDPAEVSLPYEGLRIFEGLEGEGELLADPDDLRDDYVSRMREHMDFIERGCRDGDIAYQRFATTQPLEEVCLGFLRRRL